MIALLLMLLGADPIESAVDIQQRWANYEPIAMKLNGTSNCVDMNNGKVRSRNTEQQVIDGNRFAVVSKSISEIEEGSAFGVNSKYGFELVRREGVWNKKHLWLDPDKRLEPPLVKIQDRLKLNGPFYLFEAHLPTLAKDPGFKWEWIKPKGDFIQIKFSYDPKGKRIRERGGVVTLRLDDYRTIQSFDIVGQWAPDDIANIKGEVTVFNIDETPLLRKEAIEIRGQGFFRQITREHDHTMKVGNTHLCYMSHYGLPEPTSFINWDLIYFCAAAAMIVCMLIVISLFRRRNYAGD